MKEIFAQNEAILSRVKMGHTSLFPETAFSLPLFGSLFIGTISLFVSARYTFLPASSGELSDNLEELTGNKQKDGSTTGL
jgi:hypothetical protein